MASSMSRLVTVSVQRWFAAALALGTVIAVVAFGGLGGLSPAAASGGIGMGAAKSFAVLASQTVTNTGATVISGSLGVSPKNAVTGFPPGLVNNGTIHKGDAKAANAQDALTTAYNQAAGASSTGNGALLGGRTLKAGVYTASSIMDLTGTVTLDAENNPDAVFIFQAGSELKTATGSTVQLINGANPCQVFWQVGSSATLTPARPS